MPSSGRLPRPYNMTRRKALQGLFLGGGASVLGCGSDNYVDPVGGSYPIATSSVASTDLRDYNLAGNSVGDLPPGRLSHDVNTTLGPEQSFGATYSASKLQGNGQTIEGDVLLRFERLPVLGTRGIIASVNDGRTGVAAVNNTGLTLYRVELVPADAPVFSKTNGGWEFLQAFPGGWQPGEGLFLVGIRSDLPRGEYQRRYRSLLGYDSSGTPVAIPITEEVEGPA